ncbi:MAG: hypothetical protein ETSY2_14870 [Candidatus Entotheonella gemina]|uniref:Uncharacterized protein n=1 Tax=Candidatus Entotheonella gemina TaxID=1429439 RepID=W4MB11_9BACT|nr:MAG: hypothetical protein ETSY2_14870 [Candidatus Entotheonella gemina]
MGQYYKFINKTRMEESQISLPFNFGVPWAKSLECYDDEQIKAMFRFVVKHNEGWQDDDELVAVGDYGTVITDSHSETEPTSFSWENYVPARVSPKKVDDFT